MSLNVYKLCCCKDGCETCVYVGAGCEDGAKELAAEHGCGEIKNVECLGELICEHDEEDPNVS
jgi:hypothetical protein